MRAAILVVAVLLAGCDERASPSPARPGSASPGSASPGSSAGRPSSASPAPSATPATPTCRRGLHQDLAYRDRAQPLHRLDLHVPEGGRALPLVIYVHGGAFKEGDKGDVFEKPAFFAREGFAFASINYRLSTPESGVSHPMHVEDAATAVAWLARHAGEYCADRDRMVAMGHSAGGYIVAALGADARYLRDAGAPPHALRCVMINDTEGFDLPRLFAKRTSGWIREVYANAFGTEEALWRDASPLFQLSAHPAPPQFLLVTRGSGERRGQVEAFAARAREAKTIAFVVDAGDRDHLEIDRALGAAGDDLGPTTVQFYRRCLGMDRPQ